MEREIKFRAWIEPAKSMMSWESLQESKVLALSRGLHPNCFIVLPARYELMQYTGLKDCNGVEIYEGDILRDDRNEYLWLVGFNERGCFIAHDPNDKLDFVIMDDYEFKVLGNIYENPELLENNQ